MLAHSEAIIRERENPTYGWMDRMGWMGHVAELRWEEGGKKGEPVVRCGERVSRKQEAGTDTQAWFHLIGKVRSDQDHTV